MSEARNNPFGFNKWHWDEDNAYFLINGIPCLLEYNNKTHSICNKYLEETSEDVTWMSCYKVEQYVFLFPDYNNCIARINLDTKRREDLILDEKGWLGIFDIYEYNSYLYVFLAKKGVLYKMDPIAFVLVDKIVLFEVKEGFNIAPGSFREENIIYFATGLNYLVLYDMEQEKISRIEMFLNNEDSVGNVLKINSVLWIGGCKKGNIYKFSLTDDKVELQNSLHIFSWEKEIDCLLFKQMYVQDGQLFVVCNGENRIISVNTVDMKVTQILPENGEYTIYKELWDSQYNILFQKDEVLCVEDIYNGYIFQINMMKKVCKKVYIELPSRIVLFLFKTIGIKKENEKCDLKTLIEALVDV